jgi:hypothetical protein
VIEADITGQFEAGRDEACSTIAGDGACSASRIDGDESQREPSNMTIADEGASEKESVLCS